MIQATTTATKHIILYAEDDADDVYMVNLAFAKHKEDIELVHVANGLEAIEYVNTLSPASKLPCLIILDINMPIVDGKEALVHIKNKSFLKDVPVVMFTTSNSRHDQEFAKKWGADFLTKPLDYKDLEALAGGFSKKCNFEMSKRA